MVNVDTFYMREALKEAKKGFQEEEVPVGCVIVHRKTIIARAYNMCERLCDPTAHGEMQVLTSACNYLQSKYLDQCTLYTTLSPCIMCAGALYWSKMGRLVYGAEDKNQSVSILERRMLHPTTKIEGGILADECAYLLTTFFEKKRKLEKK